MAQEPSYANWGQWALAIGVVVREAITFAKWLIEQRRKSDNETAAEKISATCATIETTVSQLLERCSDIGERLRVVERLLEDRHEQALELWRAEAARLNRIIYVEATSSRDREGDLRVANAELAAAAVEQLRRSTDVIERMLIALEKCNACDATRKTRE